MDGHPTVQQEREAGSSMVGILIGMVLSTVAMLGVSQFFLQSKTKSRDMLGETEALAHSIMLVRKGFSNGGCDTLNLMKDARFRKGASGETVVASLDAEFLKQKGSLDAIPMLKAEGIKNYTLTRIDLVQRGDVIGRDPPQVLAELQLTVSSSFNKSNQMIRPYVLKVPIMYRLEKDLRIKSCMQKPTAAEICKFRGGTFDEKTSTCK